MHHPIHGLLFLLITALTLTACVSNAPKPNPTAVMRPAWIFQPEEGVSASAAFHVQGRQAQEELAIAKAGSEFAMQFGADIQEISRRKAKSTRMSCSSVLEPQNQEVINKGDVQAKIKEKWHDEKMMTCGCG